MGSSQVNSEDRDDGVYTCIYCGVEIPEGVRPSDDVPPVWDDAAWRAVAECHGQPCEWCATRAHRLPRERDKLAAIGELTQDDNELPQAVDQSDPKP